MSKDTGGPAFPVDWETFNRSNGKPACLSVRDYFMAHAPTPPNGWVRQIAKAGDLHAAAEEHAIWARLFADAMLAERSK